MEKNFVVRHAKNARQRYFFAVRFPKNAWQRHFASTCLLTAANGRGEKNLCRALRNKMHGK
jgi:hypothetical protein